MSDKQTELKQHHIPEAMSALENELTAALQELSDLSELIKSALNPFSLVDNTDSKLLVESDKRAPLAERIWMSVQTVQTLRITISALSARLEL